MDDKWINNNEGFPDETNIYIDPRQIVIPPLSGTTEYADQVDYPDYLVDGGFHIDGYDIIDGGSETDSFSVIGDV
jgi:hypothetical protein